MTPMMQQYTAIKRQYADCILFFRMGDFYEMFNEDAVTASRELEITLTARNKGGGDKTPMAGVPHHSADSYVAQLVKKGYRVAICEQMEDPSEANGIVRRDVVRVVTPGTALDHLTLQDDQNNYLGAVLLHQERVGVAYVDISTGEFALTELNWEPGIVIDELSRIQPSELIISPEIRNQARIQGFVDQQLKVVLNPVRENFRFKEAYQLLTEHFKTQTLYGFGCEEMEAGIFAAGAIMEYLNETQKRSLDHINNLKTYFTQEYMVLDAATRRNLELTSTLRDGKRKGSLLGVLDRTVTAMGGRKLKQWINQPLLKAEQINERLDAVTEFLNHFYEKDQLRELLKDVYDIERLLGRIVYGSANARDLVALKNSLMLLPEIKNLLDGFISARFNILSERLDLLEDVAELVETALLDDPPTSVRDGGLIADGFNEELDQFRDAATNGKEWLTRLEMQERERTGIKSLKVGFNKVFGYYLEVTKANLELVPEDYIRKQTLTNSERYITPELKEKESLILGAEEKSVVLEYQLFVEIRDQVADQMKRIQDSAAVLAELDVLLSFATVAVEQNYCRPTINMDDEIHILQGRHPVVEEMLNQPFVPNDTYLNGDSARFAIITGPNMAGKSTYMRQVALITLMAQIGSFVPAEEATIGLTDRIFTRVGASDDLTTGQSTFMVEMNEVANIVHNATRRSLIILDEVGRGTSTYDGLSIAWAVVEYIHNQERLGARTLFATHYHELTILEDQLHGVRNYNVAVEENERDGVVFRHEIIPGAADQSYGIEVARLAGLPQELLERAQEILTRLESENGQAKTRSQNLIFDGANSTQDGESKTAADTLDQKNSVISFDDQGETLEKQKQIGADTDEVVGQAEQFAMDQQSQELSQQHQQPLQLALFAAEEHPLVTKLRDLDLMTLTPLDAINILYEMKKEAEGK